MSEITLDWDDITLEAALKRVSQIRLNPLVESISLSLSPCSGFHVFVSSYFDLNPIKVFKLRNDWKDDGNRLVKDILSAGRPYRDVMFNFKERGGVRWYETPLFLYTRKSQDSIKWSTRRLAPLLLQSRRQSHGYYARVV